MSAGITDPFEIRQKPSWPSPGHLLQHLAVADHGIERRAQLMAHIGEEGGFVLARRFELLVELPELL